MIFKGRIVFCVSRAKAEYDQDYDYDQEERIALRGFRGL
jgi:hypothetical protein